MPACQVMPRGVAPLGQVLASQAQYTVGVRSSLHEGAGPRVHAGDPHETPRQSSNPTPRFRHSLHSGRTSAHLSMSTLLI